MPNWIKSLRSGTSSGRSPAKTRRGKRAGDACGFGRKRRLASFESLEPRLALTAVTLGNGPSGGSFLDGWESNLAINETDTYTNTSGVAQQVALSSFNFFAGSTASPVTPFVVRVNGDNDFTVLEIGTTRTGYSFGVNSFAFKDGGAAVVLGAGETLAIGFLDANADGSGSTDATIQWNNNGDEIWYTGGQLVTDSGSVAVGSAPTPGTNVTDMFRRDYQFTIGLDVQGGANAPPVVSSPIPDIAVQEGAGDTTLNLGDYFDDADGDALTYIVTSNSNGSLVSTSINGSTLTLDYAAFGSGSADITIRATDPSNEFVDDAFTVAVSGPNAAPVVSSPIPDLTVQEGAGDTTLNLGDYFDDANGDTLTYIVTSNSNGSLVGTSINGSTLTLGYDAFGFGAAVITVRATDPSNEFIEDTFTVTVNEEIPGVGATVSGLTWVDQDRNGVRTAADAVQAQVGLKLYYDKNGDGFAERLVDRQVSDANGQYSFTGLAPGLYTVGLELNSLPDDIYEATRLDVGNDESADNDLNRNTLRTQHFEVTSTSQVLTNLTDVGLIRGSAVFQYSGQENYTDFLSQTQLVDVFDYKGLKLRIPAYHELTVVDPQDIDNRIINTEVVSEETLSKWLDWLKLTDQIQQQLFVSETFMDGGQLRVLDSVGADGGYRQIAYAGGTFASGPRSEGDDRASLLLENPNDPQEHWGLIYEMGRGHPGPWHFRAQWPPFTFMNAHLQTAVIYHEIGGLEEIYTPNAYNGLAYSDWIDQLAFWERSDYKFAEVFQDDFGDAGRELTFEGETEYSWGGSIVSAILFEIYREDGLEKMIEVMQNMARQPRLASTAAQAMINFSEAVNDAFDGAYAQKLIDVWGMPDPDAYVFKTVGLDTGAFVDQDEYKWDLIPYNSEDVADGYSPLTEQNTEGYVRWTGSPDWATRNWDNQLSEATNLEQTIVGKGYNFEATSSPSSFAAYQAFIDSGPTPDVVGTRPIAQLSGQESFNPKDYYISRWQGKLFVPSTGSYDFRVEPDDVAKLIVNGQPVIEALFQGNTDFTVELEAGWHDFEFMFAEFAGAAYVNFDYDPSLLFAGPNGETNPSSLPTYERYDDTRIGAVPPVAEDSFKLRHELRGGVWQVTVGFSNLEETQGVNIVAEGQTVVSDVTLPQRAPYYETFNVTVTDGALDLSFWNTGSPFSTIGLSSLELEFVGSVTPDLPGDYNNDGAVDAADFTVWRDALGSSAALANEDPNATPGVVSVEDYLVWRDNFGQRLPDPLLSQPFASVTTAPTEPADAPVALGVASVVVAAPDQPESNQEPPRSSSVNQTLQATDEAFVSLAAAESARGEAPTRNQASSADSDRRLALLLAVEDARAVDQAADDIDELFDWEDQTPTNEESPAPDTELLDSVLGEEFTSARA